METLRVQLKYGDAKAHYDNFKSFKIISFSLF